MTTMISLEELITEKANLEKEVDGILSEDYSAEIEEKVNAYREHLIQEKQAELQNSILEMQMEIKALDRIIERHRAEETTVEIPTGTAIISEE